MDYLDDDNGQQRERDVLEKGIHEMKIALCQWSTSEYNTSDNNPEGNRLEIRLAKVGFTGFIFADIGQHEGWKAKSLAAALGLAWSPSAFADPGEFVGQSLMVGTDTWTSKAGKTRAVVDRWIAAPVAVEQPAKVVPKSLPKSPAQKAAAQFAQHGDPDDIPF